MASGGLSWCYEDFVWFYERLTLPEGRPARLEGFQRLILRQIFTTGRVELLVLIPKGHAKTTLMAALAVFHLLITPNANCYIGAADKIQADEMYRFAAHFIEAGSDWELMRYAKVLRGTREIKSLADQGFIRVLASDDSKQGGKRQGFNPTLALLDELHAHENDNLYVDMRSGLFKRQGLLVTITTAGWDIEGVLGQLRASFLSADQDGGSVRRRLNADELGELVADIDGRLTVAHKSGGRVSMLEWALEKADDWADNAVVKMANPASWVTIDGLEDARQSLKPWIFKRYRCNLWTLAHKSWVPEASWDVLVGEAEPVTFRYWNPPAGETWEGAGAALRQHIVSLFPPASVVVGALDMARYKDTAGIVLVSPQEGRKPLVRGFAWKGSPDDPVPYAAVSDALLTVRDAYVPRALGYDPKYADQLAETLLALGVPMEEFPQSNERMCPAASNLHTGIMRQQFEHDGDPILAAHVMATSAKDVTDDAFKLVKEKSNGPPIDLCVALAMAWTLFLFERPKVSAESW